MQSLALLFAASLAALVILARSATTRAASSIPYSATRQPSYAGALLAL